MSVLVVMEQQNGRWHKMSWEALAAGQQAAESLGRDLAVCVAGHGTGGLAEEMAKQKVTRVLHAEHEALALYTPDAYTQALRAVIEKAQPELVLFPHTYQSRDFAPKLATALDRPFLSDVVEMKFEGGKPLLVRQFFQGKLHADVAPAGDPPFFASVQSGAYRADALEQGAAPAPIENVEAAIDASAVRTRPGEPFRESKGEVDLSSAERIVSVGRGIKDPENIKMAQELAELLGAEVGASRPICDNGWLPLERQVGSSGQTVTPKLYLALGISGAIQHMVGMRGAKTIVAINRDETAPIFEIADYGVAADLFEVTPALIEALKKDHGS